MGTEVLDPVPVLGFHRSGVVTPAHGEERAFIEELRRTTFGIGDGKVSKMAEILHRTIKHVSTEIYQKDVHFLSELLQNAEDNEYPIGVTPSLCLVLTYEDICKVGAPATLAIFNNECGFTRENVEALCNVGCSTKKVARERGYIGEKGIGFKSVFLVSSQPYIISNNFRMRLNESKDKEADVGFIVPEWVDYPSDVQLSQLFGVGQELPTTTILLPLKPDKVKAVQQQLAEISPEILIFLAHIKELTIRDDRRGVMGQVIKVQRKFWPCANHNELSTVELSVDGVRQESASYFCCHHKVPVDLYLPKNCTIEQRSRVKNWAITLAFPLQGRISGGTAGDVYSFLPTEHQSGLTCLLNADFLLTSSRETIQFDSPWNEGIFEAIPQVFVAAFSVMASKTMPEFLPIEAQSVYQFVPVPIKLSSNKYFARLQESVRSALASMEVVLCFPKSNSKQPPVYKPLQCRRLSRRFCEVLMHAAVRLGCQVSDFTPQGCYVVDAEVQEKFGAQLEALGVLEFDLNEYGRILGPWILKLQEDCYVKLLHFVASELGPAARGNLWTTPLLKYVQPDGSVGLATLEQTDTLTKIKVPAGMPCPWLPWLCKWIQEFFKWVPIYFLPISTVHEILQLDPPRRAAIWYWLHTCAKVTELSVREYSNDLFTHIRDDPGFCILVTQYLFSIKEQFPNDDSQKSFAEFLANRLPVVDIKRNYEEAGNAWHAKKQVMLPSCCSRWPLLLPGDSCGGHLVKMHDDYVKPQSPLVNLSADALDRYTGFLRGHFFAKDLLEIDPPNCALPGMQQGGHITDDAVHLLLDWLQAIIARGEKGKLAASGDFMASIQSFPWLPTLDHGNMRPTDVFWPSATALEVFHRPSVPFLKPTFCNSSKHGDSLLLAGLVLDVNLGLYAVVSLINGLCKQPAGELSKVTILNLYEGLRRMQWDCSEIEAIYIPPFRENSNVAQWVPVKYCIAYDEGGLFEDYFAAVLSKTYDEGLLQFFVSNFHVQLKPKVEDYCKYWKWCVEEGRQLSYGDCKMVWSTIVCQHNLCDKTVWEEFVSSVALVPAVEAGKCSGDIYELKEASHVFIPDQLEFADKFGSTPARLWIPLVEAAPENLQELHTVYSCLGANMLSECTEITLTEQGKRALCARKKRNRGWICEGLFRALLGFLQGKGHFQAGLKWLSIVSALIDTSDIEVDNPIEIQYCLFPTKDERNLLINTASGHRMVYWDKETDHLFSVDHQTAVSATNRAMIHLQFSHAIAEGLLAGYSREIVETLRRFLFGCTHVNFEVEVVNQMLRADNIQLSPEQEAFIASRFPDAPSESRNACSPTASSMGLDAGLVEMPVSDDVHPPRYVLSEIVPYYPRTDTNLDHWGDAGALCTMPPLAVEDLLEEGFSDIESLNKVFKLNPDATPFEMNGWPGISGPGGSSSEQIPLPAAFDSPGGLPDANGSELVLKSYQDSGGPASHYQHHCRQHRRQDDLEIEGITCRQRVVHLDEDLKGDANAEFHEKQGGPEERFSGTGNGNQEMQEPIALSNGQQVLSGGPEHRRGKKTGKLSNGGQHYHVKSRKSCNCLVHFQSPDEFTRSLCEFRRSTEGSVEADSKSQPQGRSSIKGRHINLTAVDDMSKSGCKSVSPSNSSPSPSEKNGGRWRTEGMSAQPNSIKSSSPSSSNESSCDYETDRVQLFLESVYELSGIQGAGMEEFAECSSVVHSDRFRFGAKRMVLPNNVGEEERNNGGGKGQKQAPGVFALHPAANRGQKPLEFSLLDQTLIKGWCRYRAPRSHEIKMAAGVDLPDETYESLDWWRNEHLPEVKRILGYTMARCLLMELGPGEEKCDIDRLLTLAFLHQKYPLANGASYQRLEFLGDACLGVAVASELFLQHPNFNEHGLTELRSALVRNSTCALFFRSARLDSHVITGLRKVNPEAVTDSIAADVFEAILGAGYVAHGKHGLLEVHRLVFEVFLPHLLAPHLLAPLFIK